MRHSIRCTARSRSSGFYCVLAVFGVVVCLPLKSRADSPRRMKARDPLDRLAFEPAPPLPVPTSGGGGTPPNVLLIMADDWAPWMGALGPANSYPGVLTPNADALAARGMNFTRAYCAGPTCTPSRAAMMTGLRPSTTGIYDNRLQLYRWGQPLAVTLPQHFMAHGYEALAGNKISHHLDLASWHHFFACARQLFPPTIPASGIAGLGTLDWAAVNGPDTDMHDYYVATWAQNYLSQVHADPFFLAVGFIRPHVPMYVSTSWFDLYPIDQINLPAILPNDLNDVPPRGVYIAGFGPSDSIITANNAQASIIQAYLASVSFMDAQLGRVISALENGPNAGNTIVVLTSDHGFHFGQKRHWGKDTLWEESTRVPLVIVAPGVTAPGQVCQRTVSLLDLYPTLIELCGLTPRPELEGVSLMPLLLDPSATWERPAVTTYPRGCHGVRSERWRYIRYDDFTEELYDHDNDPHEWTNLAGNPAYASVKTELAGWMPTSNAPDLASPPTRIYVKADAQGLNNGTNWTNAFTSLRRACDVVGPAGGYVSEVWVAAGTYKPADPGGDRRSTFIMTRDVKFYGGFAGNETSVDQRDPTVNVTTLSGDLNGDDGLGFSYRSDNCYHVVTWNDFVQDAVLDGFTITGGNADGIAPYDRGGGMYYNWANGWVSNCTIRDNFGTRGGGVYCSGASRPFLRRCTISGNHAIWGGGLFNDNVSPWPINCAFGGVANARTPLVDCIIRGNSAAQDGGGVYNFNSQPLFVQCLFSGNSAGDEGGAMYNWLSWMSIVNCTFSGNSAAAGAATYSSGSGPTFNNCVLWGNSDAGGSGSAAQIRAVNSSTPKVYYSCVEGGWSGVGNNNTSGDPLLADPDGPDGVLGTPDDDLRLGAGSSSLDAGDNNVDTDPSMSGIQVLAVMDLAGGPRFLDDLSAPDVGAGIPPIVDMGVYEGAFSDCNHNGVPDDTELTGGTSLDCNDNQQPDVCDISLGISQDCNFTNVPDDCEIASGASLDSDSNAIPDECEVGASFGDCDVDGDVDLDDWPPFIACMEGPERGTPPEPCSCADFDYDADTDLRDAAQLMAVVE